MDELKIGSGPQITLITQITQIRLMAQMRNIGIRFGVKNGSTRIGPQITLITQMAQIRLMALIT